MDNEETVQVETLETPEATEEVVEAPEEETTGTVETPDERDIRIAELEEKNKKLFERAKKAEMERKVAPSASLSSSDLLAVTNAKVHEDDIEQVERFAKAEGLSIKEALKHADLKVILDLHDEQRLIAESTNISNVRAGISQVRDESLLESASAGKIPTNDLDIERLIAAKARAAKG